MCWGCVLKVLSWEWLSTPKYKSPSAPVGSNPESQCVVSLLARHFILNSFALPGAYGELYFILHQQWVRFSQGAVLTSVEFLPFFSPMRAESGLPTIPKMLPPPSLLHRPLFTRKFFTPGSWALVSKHKTNCFPSYFSDCRSSSS